MIAVTIFTLLTVVVTAMFLMLLDASTVCIAIVSTLLVFLFITLGIVANIKFLRKIGLHGWEWLIPFFYQYKVCEKIYGEYEGWKSLLQIIPCVGILFKIKYSIRIAEVFGKSGAYGVFMFILPIPLFYALCYGGRVKFDEYETPVDILY